MSQQLEQWMKTYKPEELFDEQGLADTELAELAPVGHRRSRREPPCMPTAVLCCATCACPTFTRTRFTLPSPGETDAQDTLVLGQFLRDVKQAEIRRIANFRIFGPDGDTFEPPGRRI